MILEIFWTEQLDSPLGEKPQFKTEVYLKEQVDNEMYLNMQYYLEYCQSNGYVTPQDWIEKHKHF